MIALNMHPGYVLSQRIFLRFDLTNVFLLYKKAFRQYILMTSSKFDFLEKKRPFDFYLTFSEPFILVLSFNHLPERRVN